MNLGEIDKCKCSLVWYLSYGLRVVDFGEIVEIGWYWFVKGSDCVKK